MNTKLVQTAKRTVICVPQVRNPLLHSHSAVCRTFSSLSVDKLESESEKSKSHCQKSNPSSNVNPNPKQQLVQKQQLGCRWNDYSLISKKTVQILTNHYQQERLTLVQDAVLSILFGAPQKIKMKSCDLKVRIGLPNFGDDVSSKNSPDKQSQIMKIEEYINSNISEVKIPLARENSKDKTGPVDESDIKHHEADHMPSVAKETDLIVRSKSGTEKTLAFAVAAIESILQSPEGFRRTDVIPIVIFAPTNELVLQIHEETKNLLGVHKLSSVFLHDGDGDHAKQMKKFIETSVQVIIATPGRLLDVLKNDQNTKKRLRGLKVIIFVEKVVYDEADRFLDDGFLHTIDEIQNLLPDPSTRQTFMFSATFTPAVKSLAAKTLRPDNTLSVDTIIKSPVLINRNIKQTHVLCPFSLQPQLLMNIIQSHKKSTKFPKILVFFPFTHLTEHMNMVWKEFNYMDSMGFHRQMDQQFRLLLSDQFQKCRQGILFISDLSARGIEYSDVTLVVQMGIPRTLEHYIQRIERTSGTSILVHTNFETPFLTEVLHGKGGLQIETNQMHDPQIYAHDIRFLDMLIEAYKKIDWNIGSACYAAFLEYYRGFGPSLLIDSHTLVEAAKEFVLGLCGLPKVPKLGRVMLKKLQLSASDGTRVLTSAEDAHLRGKPFRSPNDKVYTDGPVSPEAYAKRKAEALRKRAEINVAKQIRIARMQNHTVKIRRELGLLSWDDEAPKRTVSHGRETQFLSDQSNGETTIKDRKYGIWERSR
ncbi:hypothetical protein HK100_004082 [Physocladia obscura]|uniref:ATP-dependent RNA helicase n=1 Tax=Physocladia obscura TaxID=109957 RepID=A0AAD5XA36_9FUNG|nr:hypothetical protein HK100_004082 [Physocladia obscura]